MRHTFSFVDRCGAPSVFDFAYSVHQPAKVGVITAVDGRIGGGTVWIKFNDTPYDVVLPFRLTEVCCVASVEKIQGE